MQYLWQTCDFAGLDTSALYAVLRLRQEVFAVEQDCAYLDLDNLDQGAIHMLCWLEGALVAYQRCLAPGTHYPQSALGRVVVSRLWRGKGISTRLLEHAMALARAEAEGQSDWRMLSIIGVTMDSLDKHSGAQDYYRKAIALSPDNPKILANLGLSYALDSKPGLAEQTLREAMALPGADNRITQNLVVVLGVQGKFDEAEKIAGADMPKALIESNREYFRSMLNPSRNWETLRGTQN